MSTTSKESRVLVWGTGIDGQLGIGSAPHSIKTPLPILQTHKIKSLKAGITHSVALISTPEENKVYTWGCNFFGQSGHFPQLGIKFAPFQDIGDTIFNPMHLDEGFKKDSILDVVVGDFHALAFSERAVYAWGAGMLGNGSDLFSSEPLKLELPAHRVAVKAFCAGNTSGVVCLNEKQEKEVYLWGVFIVDGVEHRALKPTRVFADLVDIDDVAVDKSQIAISGTDSTQKKTIIILGEKSTQDLIKPTHPKVPSGPLLNNDLKLPLLKRFDMDVDQFTLQHNHLIVLSKGKVHLYNLEDGCIDSLDFGNSGVDSMHFSRNAAIFKSGKRIYYCCAPEVAYQPSESMWKSIFGKKRESEKVEIRNLLEYLRNGEWEELEMEDPGIVACGWSHFLVNEQGVEND